MKLWTTKTKRTMLAQPPLLLSNKRCVYLYTIRRERHWLLVITLTVPFPSMAQPTCDCFLSDSWNLCIMPYLRHLPRLCALLCQKLRTPLFPGTLQEPPSTVFSGESHLHFTWIWLVSRDHIVFTVVLSLLWLWWAQEVLRIEDSVMTLRKYCRSVSRGATTGFCHKTMKYSQATHYFLLTPRFSTSRAAAFLSLFFTFIRLLWSFWLDVNLSSSHPCSCCH